MNLTDTIRIRQYDKYNVVVEVLSEGISPQTRELVTSWKIYGYYMNLLQAVQGLLESDLLIPLDTVETLQEYSKTQAELMDTVRGWIEKEARQYD